MAWRNGGRTRTTTTAHKRWRTAVLDRDHWTCQLRYKGCLTRAHIADHKVAVAFGGAEYDIDNGQAVCSNCHNVKTQQEAAQGRTTRSRRRPAEPHPGTIRQP